MSPGDERYILVVEDADEDFESARRALNVLMPLAPVARATTGEVAAEYLRGDRGAIPTVLILDLGLPDVDDQEIITIIASRPELDDMAVFVMTGSDKVFTDQLGAWPPNWKLVPKQMALEQIARDMVQVKVAWERAVRGEQN